jgi:hypothetical protein
MKPTTPARARTGKPTRRRKERPRPTPRWLTGRTDLDQVAQRRCLLILSVLSGEKTVTSAIAELQISRPFYYQLETKALTAILKALAPGAEGSASQDEATPARRIAELEAQVARLERNHRRTERLLYLTRRILPPGPVTVGPGRPRRRTKTTTPTRSSTHRSTTSGSPASRLLTTKATRTGGDSRPPASTPTTPGAGEP